MTQTFRYQAFISYAHADKAFAKRLHSDLERFRIHKDIAFEAPQGARPGSLGKFFRDDEELAAAPNLGDAIKSALDQSRTLIVVCSQHAARSKWVAEEISYFRDALGRHRIYALILRDEPHAGPGGAFPPMLVSNGFEPLAADFRDPGRDSRKEALQRIVAGLCGASYDAIKRRELARARAAAVRNGVLAFAGLALATAAGVASWVAWESNARLALTLESRDGQFRLVNENAITFARTLVNWPETFAGEAAVVVGGLELARYDANSSVSNPYWDMCPRNLGDCFVNRGWPLRPIAQAVVAGMGEQAHAIDTDAREVFRRLCPAFVDPPEAPLARACAGLADFDLDIAALGSEPDAVDPVPAPSASLYFGVDETLGLAVTTVDSSIYCGSGGCTFGTDLWRREADGSYYFVTSFVGDEFAILVGPNGVLEVVTAGHGQAGIASQFSHVARHTLMDAKLLQVASFTFREEYPDASLADGGVPPSLTVCPELVGASADVESVCGE